ncbi:sigma factor [Nonomuraea wenchangensis]
MRDKSDFVAYVEARSPRLLQTAYLLCRDWAQAEDLPQTALVRVWRAWGRVGTRTPTCPGSWSTRICPGGAGSGAANCPRGHRPRRSYRTTRSA